MESRSRRRLKMSFRMRRASSIERSGKAVRGVFFIPNGAAADGDSASSAIRADVQQVYIYIYIHIYIYYIYIYIHIIIYMGAKHNMPSGR